MDDTKGLSYFFLGLGVGVAVGIIFAPKSGTETRGQIRDKAIEGGDYVRRRSSELKDSANELVDRGRDLLNKQKEQLASAVDAGRHAYREAIGQARAAGSKVAEETSGPAQGI